MSTPNMGLVAPSVGITPGPTYAQNINSDLTTIDQHDHSSGKGVLITPSGMNISSDLLFQGNNATLLRSVRFSPQLSPLALGSDIGCLYESGVDLYYNDGNGNQIRITQSGSIAGASGNISGLASPASATYVPLSGTFIWQSNSNVAATMDSGPLLLRNVLASSNAIKLQPPTSSFTGYTITLPTAPPGSTLPVNMDSSGNLSTAQVSTAQIASGAVTNPKITDATIQLVKLAAFAPANSTVSSFNLSSTSHASTVLSALTTIPGLAPQLGSTQVNRPVVVEFLSNSTTNHFGQMTVVTSSGVGDTASGYVYIELVDAVAMAAVASWLFPYFFVIPSPNSTYKIPIPWTGMRWIDTTNAALASGGTVQYTVNVQVSMTNLAGSNCTGTYALSNAQLYIYQI
jgi:hypothetical protein